MRPHKYLFLLLLCGCSFPTIDITPSPQTKVVVDDSAVKLIADSMKDVSKEDAIVMRKLFVGIEQYLPVGKKLDTTLKVFTLIKTVQEDYGYSKGKYVVYTDAVEKYLKDKGYAKPKKIVDGDPKENEVARSVVVADLKVLADAARSHLESKQ